MNKNCEKLVSLSIAAMGIALFLMSAETVMAQVGHPGPAMSERERLQRQMDQRYRAPDTDFKKSKYMTAPRENARPLASPAHIKGHSERIKFLNRRMMGLVSADTVLDYKAIAKAASEIKKRARELRSYLGLPKPDAVELLYQGTDKLEGKELFAALSKLDSVIKSFSTNPLLSNRGVLDAEQAASAGRDLKEIIILSDRIGKSAKRLSRKARASR